MKKLLIIGSNGFIGSKLFKLLSCKFRTTGWSDRFDNSDNKKYLSSLIEDSDIILNAVYDNLNIVNNYIINKHILEILSKNDRDNSIYFYLGTYVRHNIISEIDFLNKINMPFRFPYVVVKNTLQREIDLYVTGSNNLGSFTLDLSNVIGEGSGWNRYAKQLEYFKEVRLPYSGQNIMPQANVEAISEHLIYLIENYYNNQCPGISNSHFFKNQSNQSWEEFFSNLGIKVSKFSCNQNILNEDYIKNALYSLKYRNSSSNFDYVKNIFSDIRHGKSCKLSTSIFTPKGLDRLTFSSRINFKYLSSNFF